MSREPTERNKANRRRRFKRTSGIFTTIAVIASGWWVWHSAVPYLSHIVHARSNDSTVPPLHLHTPANPDRETILLIGTDARLGDPLGNSDVLCVASLDTKNKRVELLSIPRDTQVAFPDGRYHKINDALVVGGPELTTKIVQTLIGLPIDHYAVTRFDGLVKMIDRIGGIGIDVPRPMHYRTGDKEHGIIDLLRGFQHLNGEQALGFVRFRHDALGDIGRTERQQAFLVALKEQLLKPSTLPKLPGLVMDMSKSFDTDMNILDLGSIAKHAKAYASFDTIHETLPGSFHNPQAGHEGDLSYWVVNPRQTRYVARAFFEDGYVQQNPIQEPSVTQSWTLSNSSAANTAMTKTQSSTLK